MSNEIHVIRDDEGMAVIGDPVAVEKFLRARGLWSRSKALDLRRIGPSLARASEVVEAVADIAASSGRWMKLTAESAKVAKLLPLLKDPKTGDFYATAKAREGNLFAKNLLFEGGPGSLLSNPGSLSSIAGLMAQTAMRQIMAEIVDYLVKIDVKVDDVLRKVDDTMVAQMVGTGHTIERALAIRDKTGTVNETLWSTVATSHQTIGATQAYALAQLAAIAVELETNRIGGLTKTTTRAERDVPKWLAVLARCFQLHEAVDILELDRSLSESPEGLPDYPRGHQAARQNRRQVISG